MRTTKKQTLLKRLNFLNDVYTHIQEGIPFTITELRKKHGVSNTWTIICSQKGVYRNTLWSARPHYEYLLPVRPNLELVKRLYLDEKRQDKKRRGEIDNNQTVKNKDTIKAEVIKLVGQGVPRKDISKKLNISTPTISRYAKGCKGKAKPIVSKEKRGPYKTKAKQTIKPQKEVCSRPKIGLIRRFLRWIY